MWPCGSINVSSFSVTHPSMKLLPEYIANFNLILLGRLPTHAHLLSAHRKFNWTTWIVLPFFHNSLVFHYFCILMVRTAARFKFTLGRRRGHFSNIVAAPLFSFAHKMSHTTPSFQFLVGWFFFSGVWKYSGRILYDTLCPGNPQFFNNILRTYNTAFDTAFKDGESGWAFPVFSFHLLLLPNPFWKAK